MTDFLRCENHPQSTHATRYSPIWKTRSYECFVSYPRTMIVEYGNQLRALIDQDELLVCPGIHDPLTAAIANEVAFDALT